MATYKGLAVPLNGDSTITGDITLTGSLSVSGDLTVTGVQESGVIIAASNYLKFSTPITTTVPTTGLDIGDMFLVIKSSTPQLAVCTDTTNNTLMYFTANTSTYGRASTT